MSSKLIQLIKENNCKVMILGEAKETEKIISQHSIEIIGTIEKKDKTIKNWIDNNIETIKSFVIISKSTDSLEWFIGTRLVTVKRNIISKFIQMAEIKATLRRKYE